MAFVWSMSRVLSRAAKATRLAQHAQLGMERLHVDGVGLEEPLEEDPVEGGDGDDREAAALRRIGHDLAEARLEHLADRAVELPEAGPHLGPLFDALEDQPQHEPSELGTLAERLAEEAPGRVAALGQCGERQ